MRIGSGDTGKYVCRLRSRASEEIPRAPLPNSTGSCGWRDPNGRGRHTLAFEGPARKRMMLL